MVIYYVGGVQVSTAERERKAREKGERLKKEKKALQKGRLLGSLAAGQKAAAAAAARKKKEAIKKKAQKMPTSDTGVPCDIHDKSEWFYEGDNSVPQGPYKIKQMQYSIIIICTITAGAIQNKGDVVFYH
jgi:hypothetical protein